MEKTPFIAALALTVAFAGTVSAQTNNATIQQPQPEVVNTEVTQGLLQDLIGDQATVEVTVTNKGASGDINVTMEIIDEQNQTLTNQTEQVYIKGNETTQVGFTLNEVPQGAYNVTAQATPAE